MSEHEIDLFFIEVENYCNVISRHRALFDSFVISHKIMNMIGFRNNSNEINGVPFTYWIRSDNELVKVGKRSIPHILMGIYDHQG